MTLIHTARLKLRYLREDDLPSLHQILADPVTMRFWPAPFTLEGTAGWIERNIERYKKERFGRCAVIHAETGELIGDCGIVRIEVDGNLENDLGYIIAKEHWGQGYATEAAGACRDYGFDVLGLQRLTANMPVSHAASRRVAEKLGMALEREFNNRRNRGIPTCLYACTPIRKEQQ